MNYYKTLIQTSPPPILEGSLTTTGNLTGSFKFTASAGKQIVIDWGGIIQHPL